ncbi:hypothetical protein BH24ACT15_BH24ACT15_32500 [soil metagenome]
MTASTTSSDGRLERRWVAIRSAPVAAWVLLALAVAAHLWVAARPDTTRPATMLWLLIPAGVVAGSRVAWIANLVLIVLVLIVLVFFATWPWNATIVGLLLFEAANLVLTVSPPVRRHVRRNP